MGDRVEEEKKLETIPISDLSEKQMESLGNLANKVLKYFDDKVDEKPPAQPLHVKARGDAKYKNRLAVADEQVPWDVEWKDYAPPDFTTDKVIEQDRSKRKGGWADPVDYWKTDEFAKRLTFESRQKDADGRPRNPRGRTGLRGRGHLGKWGANQAADPIVIRKNPETSGAEVILIQRGDSGKWAIPGGMVDDGESASVTLKREFEEEAAKLESQEDKDIVNSIFEKGDHQHVIYHGYIDDPRNTDNAWMESTVHAFVCNEKQAKLLRFEAAEGETLDVKWVPFTKLSKDELYASHLHLLNSAIKKVGPALLKKN